MPVTRAAKETTALHSPILDLLGHGQESLFDVGSVLGRSLEEGNAELVGEFL